MARITTSCLLVTALAAGAAHAGTVYVPAPGPSTLGGSSYEVQVSVTNTAPDARNAQQVLLTIDTDGTQRSGTPTTVQVQGGRTALVKPAAAFRGLLELSGGGELRYTARLAGTGPGRLGVNLPVITSDNLIRAGLSATLQGLLSGSGRAANLTVVNLAHVASQCSATLRRADGTEILSATFLLKALSQRTFSDVFTGAALSEARAAVSCNGDFFLFALLTDAATGEISYVGPSASGESLLRQPGEAPGCPANATCFEAKGIVHQPTTPANAVKRVTFTPVAGTYRRIRLTMDVLVSGFASSNPAANHMLFWLVKDRNFNMFGLGLLRGPDAHQAVLRHGVGVTHANKARIIEPFTTVVGRTYHFDYVYDTSLQLAELTISDSTGVIQRVSGTPNVGSFSFNGSEKIVVDLGFPGTNPDEAPSFGWIWRDLHVELSK
jgi:hypothetical protein